MSKKCFHPIGKNKCIRLKDGLCTTPMACMFNNYFWETWDKSLDENFRELFRKIDANDYFFKYIGEEAQKFRHKKRKEIEKKVKNKEKLISGEEMALQTWSRK